MRAGIVTIYLALAAQTIAAPSSDVASRRLEKRQSLTGALIAGVLLDPVQRVTDYITSGNLAGLRAALAGTRPGSQPATVEEAVSRLQNIIDIDKPKNIYEYSVRLAINGLLADPLTSLINGVGGMFTVQNSMTNTNKASPTKIFPKKFSCDPAYTVSESKLRAAIYIPPTFTYGKKPPVILFPGTGNTGYQTFAGNLIKQLTGSPWADPVWVNVPGSLVDDAQISTQYGVYAINYIHALTNKKVTVASWSQGGLDIQNGLKNYPSTRAVTADHVGISNDYKGTIFADFICPDGLVSCTPAVLQQQFLGASKYVTALRDHGGDSAYVPTTSIHSAVFDEIVQPQVGTDASAFINDVRGVGVTNVEVQQVCKGKGLAASFYTHESLLINPLVLALLRDAMAHDGPGKVERLDLDEVCKGYLGEGLDLGDLLVTENAIAIAGLNILLGGPRTLVEPPVMAFALKAPPTCKS